MLVVRLVAGIAAAAMSMTVGSTPARSDLKIVTLTHVDCSRMLVDGAPVTAPQLADIQTDPHFSAGGVESTIWVKGPVYRIDELGLTTVTDTAGGAITVIDRANKLYYRLSAPNDRAAVHPAAGSVRLSTKQASAQVFGYNAAIDSADVSWKACSMTCTALTTPELPALPVGVPVAVPAVADLLPKLGGMPLQLAGVVSMPSFMGKLTFDWRVKSLSTTTFSSAEFDPPAGFRRIDPPGASGLRIAVPAEVAVSPDIAVPAQVAVASDDDVQP